MSTKPASSPSPLLQLLSRRIPGARAAEPALPPAPKDLGRDEPLVEAELQYLGQWLAQRKPHYGKLADIHALDGYLTCVVITPKQPGKAADWMAEWMAWLFDDYEDKPPEGIDSVVPLLVRRMNDIVDTLVSKPSRYEPLLQTAALPGAAEDPVDAWCRGFWIACALREDDWLELMGKQAGAGPLAAIWQRGDQERPPGEAPAPVSVAAIQQAVVHVAALHKPRRRAAPKARPRGPAPGQLEQALSAQELQRLAQWLQREQPHQGWLGDIHAVDGFLTCVVVSPTAVLPSEWLAWMFKDGDLPQQDMLDLLVRRMNEIAGQCATRPARYVPLLQSHAQLKGKADPLDAWCQGFMTATVLRDEQWERVMRSGKLSAWMYPIWERADSLGDHPAGQVQPQARGKLTSKLTVESLKAAVGKVAALRT